MVVTDDDMKQLKEESINKVGKFASRHLEKAAATAAESGPLSGDLEWLCSHRPDQMCINCAPLKKGDRVDLEMLCQHGPSGRCTNCLPLDAGLAGRKFMPYKEWDAARRARCEHAFSAVCVNCTPPSAVSYKFKPGCGKHRPWPGGLCSECAPPLADLKAQPYRHVDLVQFNNRVELEGFINLWSGNERAGLQRAAWMYGYYAPDAHYPSGTKAVVEALYEPPQVWDGPTGAIRVLPDPKQKEVDAVVAALGLRRVGWIFTKKPLTPEALTVSPRELQAMAALQNAFGTSKAGPGSSFVTVVVRRTAEGIEPSGYMATDQMMALVRDGVVADAAPADPKVKVRKQGPGDPPMPEVILSSKLRGRQRGVEAFDVEIGVVTLETGMKKEGPGAAADPTATPRFKHLAFPVENRRDFGVEQRPGDLKKLLSSFKSEPLQSRLSDFHALVYLGSLFDADTAVMVATSVAKGEPLPDGVQLMLEAL
jgi:nuclear protein localization family protein 4